MSITIFEHENVFESCLLHKYPLKSLLMVKGKTIFSLKGLFFIFFNSPKRNDLLFSGFCKSLQILKEFIFILVISMIKNMFLFSSFNFAKFRSSFYCFLFVVLNVMKNFLFRFLNNRDLKKKLFWLFSENADKQKINTSSSGFLLLL